MHLNDFLIDFSYVPQLLKIFLDKTWWSFKNIWGEWSIQFLRKFDMYTKSYLSFFKILNLQILKVEISSQGSSLEQTDKLVISLQWTLCKTK